MAYDPFQVATESIFNSSIACSGVLSDNSSNQYSVKCFDQTGLIQNNSGWNTTLPENITTITISKR